MASVVEVSISRAGFSGSETEASRLPSDSALSSSKRQTLTTPREGSPMRVSRVQPVGEGLWMSWRGARLSMISTSSRPSTHWNELQMQRSLGVNRISKSRDPAR